MPINTSDELLDVTDHEHNIDFTAGAVTGSANNQRNV